MREHVFENEDDNWHLVSDAKQRKRIQDRLAQRARRRRLAAKASNPEPESDVISTSSAETDPRSLAWALATPISSQSPAKTGYRCPHATDPGLTKSSSPLVVRNHCMQRMRLDIAKARVYFPDLSLIGPSPASSPDPAADSKFLGISPITLWAALWINAQPFGEPCADSSRKRLSDRRHRNTDAVPQSLWPTETQVATEHWQWIDHFPFPRFRDNLIVAADADLVDCDEFLRDLFTTKSFVLKEGAESWDPGAWRVARDGGWGERWGWLFL